MDYEVKIKILAKLVQYFEANFTFNLFFVFVFILTFQSLFRLPHSLERGVTKKFEYRDGGKRHFSFIDQSNVISFSFDSL